MIKKSRQYVAVILAGGVCPWLTQVAGTECRIWAKINGVSMAARISRALYDSGKVERVVIMSSPPCPSGELPEGVEVREAGTTLMSTVASATAYLGDKEPIVFVTNDVPLLTGQAVADFLTQTELEELDVYYSIVCREAIERECPNAKRTYVKITEGRFTGGNIFLVQPRVLGHVQEKVEEVFALRKDIWGLCKWLGFSFVWQYVFSTLPLHKIEARASELFAFRGRAIVSNYASIGMDVDKQADWMIVEQILQKREGGGHNE